VNENLRVAFFPDSYLEVNGAAMTSRRLADYALRQNFPFLCIHAGPETGVTTNGSVSHLSLKRSRAAIFLDEDLAYDPLFQRHTKRVLQQILEFDPDVLHVTGVNDVSIIGVYLAWRLHLPLLGSWHTNLHEFAASRLERIFRFFPSVVGRKIASAAETMIMKGALLYYQMPKVILSPNQELVEILGKGTGRESRLMGRGVDTDFFNPSKRTVKDGIFRFGFVGRLRAEKNVRMLADIEKALLAAGKTGFEFLIVGEGNERDYLEENMETAVMPGFLEGEPLAEAYANMDVFVFPSKTETFGNVAREAHASGVPVIASDKGGAKYIVNHGETGFVARDLNEYIRFAMDLLDDRDKLEKMKSASREKARTHSWDSVFEGVYDGYLEAIKLETEAQAAKAAQKHG
jgi:glycosyltransferase involved in cell wall biosynthesis